MRSSIFLPFLFRFCACLSFYLHFFFIFSHFHFVFFICRRVIAAHRSKTKRAKCSSLSLCLALSFLHSLPLFLAISLSLPLAVFLSVCLSLSSSRYNLHNLARKSIRVRPGDFAVCCVWTAAKFSWHKRCRIPINNWANAMSTRLLWVVPTHTHTQRALETLELERNFTAGCNCCNSHRFVDFSAVPSAAELGNSFSLWLKAIFQIFQRPVWH